MEEKILIKSERYNVGKRLLLFMLVIVGIFLLVLCSFYAENLEYAKNYKCDCGWYTHWRTGTKYYDVCYMHEYSNTPEGFAAHLVFFNQWIITSELVIIGIGLICLLIYMWMRSYEMTITDKRVYGKAAFGKRVDLPVDSVSAIGSKWPNGIAVATSSGKIAFLMIKNRDEIHKCVSDLLIERQAKAVTPVATIKQEIPQSNADELKKFKELLDSGVITQEEFDAKKKQLLGL